MSTVLDGYHGVSGVALSVPSIVDRSGVRSVVEVAMSPREERQFADSAAAVRSSLDSLGL